VTIVIVCNKQMSLLLYTFRGWSFRCLACRAIFKNCRQILLNKLIDLRDTKYIKSGPAVSTRNFGNILKKIPICQKSNLVFVW